LHGKSSRVSKHMVYSADPIQRQNQVLTCTADHSANHKVVRHSLYK